jgi:hypothetical protein
MSWFAPALPGFGYTVTTALAEAVWEMASETRWVKVVVTEGVTVGEATVVLLRQPVHAGLTLQVYV